MFGGQIVQTRFFGKSCEHDWWTNRLNVADGNSVCEPIVQPLHWFVGQDPVNMISSLDS